MSWTKLIRICPFILLIIFNVSKAISQNLHQDKVQLSTYIRLISDAKGNKRMDENVVGNIRLNKWLRTEVGIRYGQRPANFNSYFHYKLELQTKYFWNHARVIARISDNILMAPSPQYRKTNELFVAEMRIPFGSFTGFMGAGYVFSSQQFDNSDALPTGMGVQKNSPTYRLSLRYKIKKDKGFAEVALGTYDVFNPYDFNRPFTQIAGDYSITEKCSLFSYFRYQFNQNIGTPFNYFIGLGLVFHFR